MVAITGATSGIGRAAALAFAAEGGKVAFCGRREELGYEDLSSGGMGAIQSNLAKLPERDVAAIAEYLVSLK